MSIWRGAFICLAFAFAGLALLSCHHDDDDDCHTHIRGGVIFTHCHDDDFDDDDDFHRVVHGEVSVVVTDSPRPDLRSFFVTINEVSLESVELGSLTLYESAAGWRVDLLSLRGTNRTRLYEMLLGGLQVPSAEYESIRLAISDPTLVLEDGEVVDGSRIEMVAGGEIDLEFVEPQRIDDGDSVFLVLDFDVDRSLSARAPGAGSRPTAFDGSRWRFRPVVFVETRREDIGEVPTPADVRGRITELDREAGRLSLELPDQRGRADVVLGEGAATRGKLTVGSEATVRGRFTAGGAIEAAVVLAAATRRLSGDVLEASTRDRVLLLSVEGDSGFPGRLEVQVTDGTALTFGRLDAAELGDFQSGRRVGVTTLAPAETGARPIAAILDLDERLESARADVIAAERRTSDVEGVVASIDWQSRRIVIDVGARRHTATVPDSARILLLEDYDGILWQTPISLGEVKAGMAVECEGASATAPSLLLVTPQ